MLGNYDRGSNEFDFRSSALLAVYYVLSTSRGQKADACHIEKPEKQNENLGKRNEFWREKHKKINKIGV